jgi:flagellin-like protein
MEKGISTIIAVILMLIITIALAGTAYVYISGLITARTAQTISSDADCVDGRIVLVVYNQGTHPINNTATEKDLRIYVNGTDQTDDFRDATTGSTTYGITPQGSVVLIGDTVYPSNEKETVLVKTSSNSNTHEVWC